MFFEEYTNFEGRYLSRCRDIPLQSFGSHIRPQPHGLGLSTKKLKKIRNPEAFCLLSKLLQAFIYLFILCMVF
jgi:hypothetical protein